MQIDDEARAAQMQFVAAGQKRISAPLDALNGLADRLGGQNGMILHALHGTLVASFSALLNHIAGIAEPEPVPHETDPSVDRSSADPAAMAQPDPNLRRAEDISALEIGQALSDNGPPPPQPPAPPPPEDLI